MGLLEGGLIRAFTVNSFFSLKSVLYQSEEFQYKLFLRDTSKNLKKFMVKTLQAS